MREADPLPVESDDPRLERWCQPLVATDARRLLDHLFHGLWVCGGGEQVVAARRRQCREPAVYELVQRFGHRQWLARLWRDSCSLERPDDLEGEKRVSAGCVMDLGEERARQCYSEAVSNDVMERAYIQRGYFDRCQTVCRQRTLELGEHTAFQRHTTSEQQSDALVAQPSGAVSERSRGCRIEPLDVVHRDDERSLLGQRSKRI